ncbi:MAG: hypothetical protein IJX58_06015 [Clostridia bacterium]|nr:hypothetical protein [Clostridia bacterium]
MRNTRKILVALVIVLAMMMSVATLFASAASQPETLYLTPNANWKQSNARFAAYFFGNGETWVSMTDADGDGVYEVKVPTDKVYPNVIFCRMNPSAAANNWNNKWNQTADLTIPTSGANHFTVKEGTWDSGGGTWSTYGSTCLHTNLSAEATCTTAQTCLDCGDPVVSALGHSFNSDHLCTRCNVQATFTVAGSGAHLGTEWDTGNTANDMTYDAETGTYTKVYEKVSAGSYAFKVVRDHAWGTAYPSADKLYTVADAGSTVTITLKGTTVSVNVELPVVECEHDWSDATCDKPQICSKCGQSQGEALGHKFDDGSKCSVCGFAPVYTIAGDNADLFGTTWDPTNTANKMTYDKETGLWTISYVNKGDATIWPNLKVCLDLGWTKCWGGAAAGQTDDNAWVEVPAGKMLTIAFDSTTEKITFTISDPPHVHSYFYPCDPVCQECYEVSNPDAKHDVVHVEAKAGTDCQSYDGNVEYWYCSYCGTAWTDEAQTQLTNLMNVKVAGAHSFAEGKCSVCGEEDPDYVAPDVSDKITNVFESKDLPTINEGDVSKGDTLKVGSNEFFTLIFGDKGKTQSSKATFEDGYESELRLSFNGNTKVESGDVSRSIMFTTNGPATITVWWKCGSDGRNIEIYTFDGSAITAIHSSSTDSVKDGLYITTFEIEAAGTYYLGHKGGTNYFYKVALTQDAPAHEHNFVNGKCECGAEDPNYVPPHVNTLVVGDTNKIVVSGNFVNAYNLPIEWVPFVADENAFYSFVGDNGALAMIFSADGTALLCGGTGKANLEAGNYLICVGNGAVGEFNVAVTKSAWVNTLVIGANKLLITDALSNDYGYYIVWAPFEVTEKANYTFTGEGILALVYDSAYAAVTGTELDAGTYYVCVAFTAGPATAGVATVNVEKTAIGGGDVEEPELPALQLGDNTVTIDGSVVNLTGSAIAWLEFVVAEDGIYTVSSADLNCYIYSEMNLASADACLCKWTGTAELTAGTYYVCVGKEGVTGEFTVKAEKLGDDVELPAVNTIVVGENKYVLNQALKDKGYEWLYLTVEEDGIYTFSGLSPLTFFIWPDYPNQATVPDTAPFVWNVDNLTGAITDSIEVELVAGTYLVGFRYDGIDAAGNYICEVGEYTYTITRSEKPAHEHEFVEGKCECGEEDPNYVPPVDENPVEPELTLIQKIIKAITEFFAKIADFFKNFFVKK